MLCFCLPALLLAWRSAETVSRWRVVLYQMTTMAVCLAQLYVASVPVVLMKRSSSECDNPHPKLSVQALGASCSMCRFWSEGSETIDVKLIRSLLCTYA